MKFIKPWAAALGELVKLLTEKPAKRSCNQVLLGLTGQPGLLAKLKSSHESSPRLFTIFSLKPLKDSESKEVILSGLAIANKINSTKVSIEEDALTLISQLAEGYPHFQLKQNTTNNYPATYHNLFCM